MTKPPSNPTRRQAALALLEDEKAVEEIGKSLRLEHYGNYKQWDDMDENAKQSWRDEAVKLLRRLADEVE